MKYIKILFFLFFFTGCFYNQQISYKKYKKINFSNKEKLIFENKKIIDNFSEKEELSFKNKKIIDNFLEKEELSFKNKKIINNFSKKEKLSFENKKKKYIWIQNKNTNYNFKKKNYIYVLKNNDDFNYKFENKNILNLKKIKIKHDNFVKRENFYMSLEKLVLNVKYFLTSLLFLPFEENIEKEYETKNIYKKEKYKEKGTYDLPTN